MQIRKAIHTIATNGQQHAHKTMTNAFEKSTKWTISYIDKVMEQPDSWKGKSKSMLNAWIGLPKLVIAYLQGCRSALNGVQVLGCRLLKSVTKGK